LWTAAFQAWPLALGVSKLLLQWPWLHGINMHEGGRWQMHMMMGGVQSNTESSLDCNKSRYEYAASPISMRKDS